MAGKGSTLRFVVEVAADQATSALQAISSAANQAGVQMRSSLMGVAPAAKQAGDSVVTLGDKMRTFASAQRSEARAAGFYVRELSAIIPMSGQVSTALTGLTQALVGGLGIGTAIGLVITGISLFVGKMREEEEAHRKAAKAAEEHAKKISDLNTTARRYQLQAEGFRAEQIDAMEAIRPLDAQLATLTQRYGLLGAQIEELTEAERGWRAEQEKNPLGPGQARAGFARSEIERLTAERESITAEIKKLQAEREAHAAIFKGRVNVAEVGAQGPGPSPLVVDSTTVGPGQIPRGPKIPLTVVGDETLKRTKDLVDFQELYNQQLQESIALQTRWGQAIGEVTGALITQQITGRQAVAQLLQLLIKEATSYAIAAAVGAAKSQAPIPVVGPALAISAAGAMLAALVGMIGSMPSAKGGWWDTGSYEGLMMIHKREMVLPEREAEAVRRGGSGGLTVNITGAADSRDVQRMLEEELPRVWRRLQRQGAV